MKIVDQPKTVIEVQKDIILRWTMAEFIPEPYKDSMVEYIPTRTVFFSVKKR